VQRDRDEADQRGPLQPEVLSHRRQMRQQRIGDDEKEHGAAAAGRRIAYAARLPATWAVRRRSEPKAFLVASSSERSSTPYFWLIASAISSASIESRPRLPSDCPNSGASGAIAPASTPSRLSACTRRCAIADSSADCADIEFPTRLPARGATAYPFTIVSRKPNVACTSAWRCQVHFSLGALITRRSRLLPMRASTRARSCGFISAKARP